MRTKIITVMEEMKNEEVMKGVCLHSKETVDIKVKIIRISSDPQDLQQVRVLKFS